MDRLQCDRMFVAVMQLGSFARAAGREGTSKGQASKLIARLEQELGVQLFKRSTRSLVATDVGLAYFQRVKILLEGFDELDDVMRSTSKDPFGTVRLTVPVTFGKSQLASHLIAFSRQYPKIALDVQFSDHLVNIVDEGFDLALRIGQLSDSSLMARKLCNIRVVTVASPQYIATVGAPTHWQALSACECIIDTNFRDPYHWTYQEGKSLKELPVMGRLHFSNAEVCLEAAKAGLGIARLPTFVACEALRQQQLVTLLDQYEVPPLGLFALYPPSKHLAQTARVLIDFLVASFAGPQPDWDQGW